MARANSLLATTSFVCAVAALWQYCDNRSLRAQLAEKAAPKAAEVAPQQVATTDTWAPAASSAPARPMVRAPMAPALPPIPQLSWLDRRLHRQQELTAMLGRNAGETDDQYRARVVPLVKAALALPREHAEEMRKSAEDLAHVTPAQSQQLDQVFQKVYADAVTYANGAITDGTLSPYDPSIASMLQFGGGLGSLLQDANTQIGRVLSPDQLRAMSAGGFEWGQYLGLEIPWEQLTPPPPPKP
ncbi:MAG TPA: hypothetical protein VLX92_25165 [Kofleriaceae bacterium]|nr:hypothetical protein [Kofleriaceae bacterium]